MSRDTAAFVTPLWDAPVGVRALQTVRAGGVSAAPYDSLNLGLHVGDDPGAVERNRALSSRALPDAPRWLRQVHGTRIADADAGESEGGASEADGAATSTPNRVVGVLTADCLPVVLTNAAGTRVCVVHAGWRGLAAGIVRAAVEAFDADDALHVWLGTRDRPGGVRDRCGGAGGVRAARREPRPRVQEGGRGRKVPGRSVPAGAR